MRVEMLLRKIRSQLLHTGHTEHAPTAVVARARRALLSHEMGAKSPPSPKPRPLSGYASSLITSHDHRFRNQVEPFPHCNKVTCIPTHVHNDGWCRTQADVTTASVPAIFVAWARQRADDSRRSAKVSATTGVVVFPTTRRTPLFWNNRHAAEAQNRS